MESGGADHNFSTMFSTLGYELSDILVHSIIHTIHTSSLSSQYASDFIHWLNYHSPISPINIHQILSSVFNYYLQYYGAHHRTFPTLLGDELYNELVRGIAPNIDYFSISNASDFFDWLNYHSPISSMNIHQTLDSAYANSLLHLYPQQPPFIPPTANSPSSSFMFMPTNTYSDYEDLVDLQEQIGHVNVGLAAKTISKNLKTTTLIPGSKVLVKDEGEICVICQDEYKLNETIGTLHCGHICHANCVKQWLLQKNVCPICKATALVI